jgi:hypothetical protein
MEEEGIEILAENIKKTLHSKDIFSDRTQTKYTAEHWIWICGLNWLRTFVIDGIKTFIVHQISRICFTLCEILITLIH